jgi:hypothetical protein
MAPITYGKGFRGRSRGSPWGCGGYLYQRDCNVVLRTCIRRGEGPNDDAS